MRRLVDDRWEEETDELSDGEEEEKMEVQEKTKSFKKPGRYYRNQVSSLALQYVYLIHALEFEISKEFH